MKQNKMALRTWSEIFHWVGTVELLATHAECIGSFILKNILLQLCTSELHLLRNPEMAYR